MGDRGQMGPTPMGPVVFVIVGATGIVIMGAVQGSFSPEEIEAAGQVIERGILGLVLTGLGGFTTNLVAEVSIMSRFGLEGP